MIYRQTRTQYNNYCNIPESLTAATTKTKVVHEQIELLTLLIEKYDEEHSKSYNADPIQLLKYLMNENEMKAVDLAKLLNVSEGLVSDMVHYKKGLSKETIRILSERFNVNHEAFNRPYQLKSNNIKSNKTRSMIKRKILAQA